MTRAAAIVALLLVWPVELWAGSPRLTHLYPAGGQRGTESEITCRGGNLQDAQGILFDEPGFEATAGTAEKNTFKVKIKVPADARLGEHRLRVVTASGLSDVRLFYVSPFPFVGEQESKEQPDRAQPIALGTTVFGRTQGEDQDRFVVELKRGQRLSAEVMGRRLETQAFYDPVLTITHADGQILAEADDGAFAGQDPVLSVLAPEDGPYFLTIKDTTNSGQGECEYLLNVGSFARPTTTFPLGGRAGESLPLVLLGDAGGPEQTSVTLPAQAQERWPIFPPEEPSPIQPNFLRVSDLSNVLEVEPNDDFTRATANILAIPYALNGRVETPGDLDFYKFTAKKGQALEVNVFARQLRSPLDAVVEIFDAKGHRLTGNDDAGGPDSYQRWTAPADGEFYLSVQDQLRLGGPNFTYRVELTPVAPKIAISLPEMVPNSNQERRAFVVPRGNRTASLVRVKRSDVAGEIQLTPRDLPPGLHVSAPPVDKTVESIPMVFEADANATPVAQMFDLDARLTEPPKDIVVRSAVENEIDIAENGNQPAFYRVKENRLAVQIAREVPLKISLTRPQVPLLQSGSINLKVVAERSTDFQGEIDLALLYTPPGLGTSGQVKIKKGETEGIITVSANGDAPVRKWQVCVVGSADFGQGPVWISTALIDLEVAAPFVAGKIARTFVDQGGSTEVTVALERKIAFAGKAKLQLLGLPPNTKASECEITGDDQQAAFTVTAEPTAPAGQHRQLFCQFLLERDGEPMISTFAKGGILRIDQGTVAKVAEVKP